MLAYLDALIAALSVRDAAEVARLLAHPLARILPETVRDEALAFTSVGADPLAAPLHTMRLRHQTAELLREGPVVADLAPEASRAAARDGIADGPRPTAPPSAVAPRRPSRLVQMELPLSA